MTNPFTNAYDMAAMTAAINKLPNLYGRLNAMNLFPFAPINTTSVLVEQKNGTLNIVRSRPRLGSGLAFCLLASALATEQHTTSPPVMHLAVESTTGETKGKA